MRGTAGIAPTARAPLHGPLHAAETAGRISTPRGERKRERGREGGGGVSGLGRRIRGEGVERGCVKGGGGLGLG